MKKGIDVSRWQGDIDWKKVKLAGVEFAMIRGGYGKSSKDVFFEKNYTAAKEADIPIGVYHYSYALSVEDAKKEAESCLAYLKGKKFEYPVAFDIEDKTQNDLSKDLISKIALTFCDTVEKAGYYVSIYSNKSWLSSKLDMTMLSRFDIWLAQWSDEVTYNGSYGMWQYSSKGKIDGINGSVDLNYSYKDYEKIIAVNNLNGFKNAIEVAKPVTPAKPTAPSKPISTANKYAKGNSIKLKKLLFSFRQPPKKKPLKKPVLFISMTE